MNLDEQRRAQVTDVLLAIGLFISSLASVSAYDTAASGTRVPDTWAYALIALQTLPLIWRRRAPVTVLSLTIVGFIIDRGLNYPGSWAVFGISIAIYTVGAQLEPRRSLLVGGITIDIVLLWTVVGVFAYDVEPLTLLSELAFLGFPLLVGRESYSRQRRMVELEARAIRAEHEREQRAAEAVSNERIRIARELHDVVAHQVTVATVQSAGAQRVLGTDSARAADAMQAAEEAGHRALTEMRRLLGMLRTDDPMATAPQPGLDALESLVAQMNQAGLATTLSVAGETRELPPGVDLNAYRIIQESLTNALKHGGPKVRAEVKLNYSDDTLTVDVVDDGRGAAAPAGDGQGLVGMHERVALLRGSMQAGPRPGGGFRVAAKIPIPA